MAIYQDDVPLSPQEVQIAYNCGVSISADRNYRSEELTAEQVLLKQRGEEFEQVSIKTLTCLLVSGSFSKRIVAIIDSGANNTNINKRFCGRMGTANTRKRNSSRNPPSHNDWKHHVRSCNFRVAPHRCPGWSKFPHWSFHSSQLGRGHSSPRLGECQQQVPLPEKNGPSVPRNGRHLCHSSRRRLRQTHVWSRSSQRKEHQRTPCRTYTPWLGLHGSCRDHGTQGRWQ